MDKKIVYHQKDNIIFIAPTQKMFCSFKGPTDIAVSSVNTTLKQGRLAINIYYQLKKSGKSVLSILSFFM